MVNFPILSVMIWFPLLGAFLVLAAGDRREVMTKSIAVVTTLLSFILSCVLYYYFDASAYSMQFSEEKIWIPTYHILYSLGIDGISLVMVMLTCFTGLLVVIAGCHAISRKISQYMAIFLTLQAMMIGVFCARDAMLFYVFWEGMLIPMYLSIGIWGSENRSYASIKFFLYTFLGSVLMLVALLYLYNITGNFSIEGFYHLPLPLSVEKLLFFAFLIAFAVKVPMWPLHTWLPDAHTEAPAGGSVVLAALMLKLGIYGFLRFSMPIAPNACEQLAWMMIGLSLLAVVYIGLIAIIQKDMKKLIAYSSVAHMGFSTLGCFMVYDIIRNTHSIQDAYMSLEGAVVQMIAHAFGSGAMFLGIGLLAQRMSSHSRRIADYGGVAHRMPIFAAFFLLFAMSNVGLPGTGGFVGEFMVILSAFQTHFWVSFTAATTLVLSASYTLWMYKRVFFGEVISAEVSKMQDVNWIEFLNYVILAAGVLWLGFYPAPLIHTVQASIAHLLLQIIPPHFNFT